VGPYFKNGQSKKKMGWRCGSSVKHEALISNSSPAKRQEEEEGGGGGGGGKKERKKRRRRKRRLKLGMVVHTCNPGYRGGQDWEDGSSRLAPEKS
jgi:hypothetical protein